MTDSQTLPFLAPAWRVYSASAGCLPDAEPIVCDTFDDAREALAEMIGDIADGYAGGLVSTGTAEATAEAMADRWAARADAWTEALAGRPGAFACPGSSLYSIVCEDFARFAPVDFDAIVGAYVECALWATADPDGPTMDRPIDGHGDTLETFYGAEDFAPCALASIREDVADFLARPALADALRTFAETIGEEQIGHDLLLTRERHGAGFWDRGAGSAGDVLTDAAHALGSADIYPGSDGRLYVAGAEAGAGV